MVTINTMQDGGLVVIVMPSLDQSEKTIIMGLHSTTCNGNTSERVRGPIGRPLSLGVMRDVRVCSVWHGLHGASSALSLDGGR